MAPSVQGACLMICNLCAADGLLMKVCTGKPQNTFGFEGSCMNKEFAMKIIHENHEMWTTLVSQQPQEII